MDDETGERQGRALSRLLATTQRTAFQLERWVDGSWLAVSAWMPRRVRDAAGGLDHLVAPARPVGVRAPDQEPWSGIDI